MQHTPNSVVMFVSYGTSPTVHGIYHSHLNFDLATFLLVLCFTLVFEGGLKSRVEATE